MNEPKFLVAMNDEFTSTWKFSPTKVGNEPKFSLTKDGIEPKFNPTKVRNEPKFNESLPYFRSFHENLRERMKEHFAVP